MLYYIFDLLREKYNLFGAGLFHYISFRALLSALLSLTISMLFGKRLIAYLQRLQIGESIRDLGLQGQLEKKGTPTMGGLIIIAAILIPTLLFAKLNNVYIILMIVTTIWMGLVGFLDDYIKVFKKNKEGLQGKFKIMGQVGLGIIIGLTLYFHEDVVIREYSITGYCANLVTPNCFTDIKHSLTTTIPFMKNNELDYSQMFFFLSKDWSWVGYCFVAIFIITAVSNGANITDGIDGLAAGCSAIIGGTLGLMAYFSGNKIIADYLNIMHIPLSGELMVFSAAFVGACIGFLWYNSFPAQVFMGDTGSLAIGGIIATMALAVRKELLIPILCGVFLVENLSVMLQVAYFKYQKRIHCIEYAREHRLFKMAPLHHHYQKLGFHESKIVTRFWIICIMCAIACIATLKMR